jgi:AcrR family transcriptional regulator
MLKETILGAAVTLARSQGLRALTRHTVAHAAESATGTINYHFGSMDGLRTAVVDYAIQHEIVEVLVQARAERHPRLRGRLTPALKERVANYLTGR